MMWRDLSFRDESKSIVYDPFFLFPHGSTTLRAGNTSDAFDAGRQAPVVRDLFYLSCGMNLSEVVRMKVEHKATITLITHSFGTRTIPCDGLITTLRGVPLSLATGDCAPLMLADENGRAVGLIHVGRHNIACLPNESPDEGALPKPGVVECALSLFKSIGVAPGRIRALIGPAILECCYNFTVPAMGITMRLQNAGVRQENIAVMDSCTCCTSDTIYGGFLFPSHRRCDREKKNEWKGQEKEGRLETAIMLPI